MSDDVFRKSPDRRAGNVSWGIFYALLRKNALNKRDNKEGSFANGKQKYAPIQTEDIHVSSKYKRVLSEGILHMDNAENILVIKTVPGMAMACAAAIDSISLHGVLGCIAGDDTIMCVVKETPMVEEVMKEIDTIMKGHR